MFYFAMLNRYTNRPKHVGKVALFNILLILTKNRQLNFDPVVIDILLLICNPVFRQTVSQRQADK